MAGQSQAAKTVFVAGVGMFAIVLAQAVRHPGSFGAGKVYKQIWAIGALTLILGAAADFAPAVIVPFAVAIVIAFAVKNPGALGSVLGGGALPGPVKRKGGVPGTASPTGPVGGSTGNRP